MFGFANGRIAMNELTIGESHKFIERQSLQMHDHLNGKITSLQFSFDQKQLFSAGVDGNLFLYSTTSMYKYLRQPAITSNSDAFDYPEAEDIRDVNRLSLEQEKLMIIAQSNAERVDRKKSEILELINHLRIEFDLVNERNSRLPESMRLSETDFEIDPRITDDIQAEILRQTEADRMENLIEMNKICSQWSKVDKMLLHNVECWAISLLGVRYNGSVETFWIEKFSDNFRAVQSEFENRAIELKSVSDSVLPDSSAEQYGK